MTLKVHLYALCWNEEKLLPYFLWHYDRFVDQFFIYDNYSTDNSAAILKAHPKVLLRNFTVQGDSFVLDALHFYNNIWKHSRGIADWVILCNIDEHFYHPNCLDYLQKNKQHAVTIIPSKGYEMISDHFPDKPAYLHEQVNHGAHYAEWWSDKIFCFNPNEILEINFEPGRHAANPIGNILYPIDCSVKMLHFKALGLNYVISRYTELNAKLKSGDRKHGFGNHYSQDKETITRIFNELKARASKVI